MSNPGVTEREREGTEKFIASYPLSPLSLYVAGAALSFSLPRSSSRSLSVSRSVSLSFFLTVNECFGSAISSITDIQNAGTTHLNHIKREEQHVRHNGGMHFVSAGVSAVCECVYA